ncbi:MAG: AraC family transcriptional regulator [Actinomycetia bacterium]|nr:AraC family transcriptional regulator [Actinomycetes bacterium]
MVSVSEDQNRRMLRARDAMDRDFDRPLDIGALARIAYVSEAHFIRTFKETFGETPHRYLQRRRIERAMWDLRASDKPITDIAFAVGFSSLGTFSRTFRDVVGVSPSEYRQRTAGDVGPAPTCFRMAWQRPREASSFGEARGGRTDLVS